MARIVIIVVLIVLAVNVKSQNLDSLKTPRFWIWMHSDSKFTDNQWDSVCVMLEEMGIRGLFLSENVDVIKKVIPIANNHQIQVHAWMWAMNRSDAPAKLLSVNALGNSLSKQKAYVDYYKFLCPALPETEKFVLGKMEALMEIPGLSGIHLDYIRYVDVFLPKALQPNYNLVQDTVMPQFDYGYHPQMIKQFKNQFGKSPYEIPNYANDSTWRQFRMDKVTNVVNTLTNAAKSKGMIISAAVFPEPEMAAEMVRQDWGKWNLDLYFPMVYYNFYDQNVDWVGEIIHKDIIAKPENPIICGLYIPGIKTTDELEHAMRISFENGAKGISFFEILNLNPENIEIISRFTQEMGVWVE